MTRPSLPELPPLPAPRARAMVLLWNPDAGADDFAAVVESDPALTAAVLAAANSAASSPVNRILRVQDAVVRIGAAAARQLLSMAIVRSEFGRLDESQLDVDEMWRHLLATALLTEELAEDEEGPVAFTAGLLHDVGRLAMAHANAIRYSSVIDLVRRGADVMEAERRIVGIDHAAFGRRICEAWRLPDEFVDAVGSHHDPEADGLAWAVVQARTVAWELGFGDGIAVPADPTFAVTDEQRAAVDRLGGIEGIVRMIRWYRDATVSRH